MVLQTLRSDGSVKCGTSKCYNLHHSRNTLNFVGGVLKLILTETDTNKNVC